MVRCTPGRDISWPSLELHQVRLTFVQTYPQYRHLVAKSGTISGQADLGQIHHPLVEASSGQAWNYFRSG